MMQDNRNESRRDNSRTEERKRCVRRGPAAVLAALLIVVLASGAAVLIVRNTPTNRRMPDEEYFGTMQADEAAIVLGSRKINERAVVRDGALYLPYDIVQNTLNGRFYWDPGIAKMLFTTAEQEFEIPVNSSSYSVIDGVRTTDPISEGTYDRVVVLRPEDGRITGADATVSEQDAATDSVTEAPGAEGTDGTASSGNGESAGGNTTGLYVSADFLQQYTQVEYTWKKDSGGAAGGHVLIRYQWGDTLTAKAVKDAAVRFRGGIKSPILTTLAKGDSVSVLEQLGRWTQVLTDDGYIGYVKSSRISEPETERITTDFKAQEYPSITMKEKVNLVWHQISSKDGNDFLTDAVADMTGVNVISPTWFSLADNDGNITSIGEKKYVRTAHGKGLQVWGLVSDFSGDMDTSAVLASTAARRNCIGQLTDDAQSLGLDGINLDFEYMEQADAPAYVQFVRELSIECRLKSLVLSVDLAAPFDFNEWENRREIAAVCDYLINMGYDEHYAGSEAGSVASLSYEERALRECIRQGVPAGKLISAVPFYTRIWYTSENSDGSVNTSSEVLSMGSVAQTMESWNVTPGWDADTFQHLADWTTGDGVRCRIWIEDADSLAAKARLIPQYDLAGIASWALGFQSSDVWSALSDNIALSRTDAENAQKQAESEFAVQMQAESESDAQTRAAAEETEEAAKAADTRQDAGTEASSAETEI